MKLWVISCVRSCRSSNINISLKFSKNRKHPSVTMTPFQSTKSLKSTNPKPMKSTRNFLRIWPKAQKVAAVLHFIAKSLVLRWRRLKTVSRWKIYGKSFRPQIENYLNFYCIHIIYTYVYIYWQIKMELFNSPIIEEWLCKTIDLSDGNGSKTNKHFRRESKTSNLLLLFQTNLSALNQIRFVFLFEIEFLLLALKLRPAQSGSNSSAEKWIHLFCFFFWC